MKAKSIFLILILSTIFASGAVSQSKKVAIFNPNCEGLSSEESSWLPSSVRRKLEANFNDYLHYQLIEIQNESDVKALQKKAEGSAYDSNTAIELGKLVSAEYGVFTTITKANNKYILSSHITNLTTGVRLSTKTTDGYKDCSSLIEGASSGVNVITVKFSEDLGIKLSAIDRYILLKGKDLTDSQQITLTEEEIKNYKQRMYELNQKLKEISVSTDLDAESQKAKIEAEKALLEQQEAIANDRLERLRKQSEQLAKDQEEQLKRSEEQRLRIENVAKEAELKAEQIRNKMLENLTIDGQMAIVEAKKQALKDIRDDVEHQINTILSNAHEDYLKQVDVIDNEPLRKGETDSNGVILAEVRTRRNNLKKKALKELEDQASKDVNELKAQIEVQENALIKSIEDDLKQLAKKHTISSLEDPRILFVGNYAGDKYQWESTAALYINESCIFNQFANINYQNLTGKSPVKASDEDYNKYEDYLDTVDLYDYMFRRQVPVVNLEIDYSIEAMDELYPSAYKLIVHSFRYVDVRNNKVIQTISPAKNVYRFQINPAVDLHNPLFSKNIKLALNESKSQMEQISGVKTEKTKKEPKPKIESYNQAHGNGGRFNMGINFQMNNRYFGENTALAITPYMTVPFGGYFFIYGDFSVLLTPQFINTIYIENEYLLFLDGGLGLNFRLPIGKYYPDFYIMNSFGGTSDADIYDSKTGKRFIFYNYKASAGIDIPMSDLFCVTFEYSYNYYTILKWDSLFTIGCALSL